MLWMADCIFAIRGRGSVCKITMTTRNNVPTIPWQSFPPLAPVGEKTAQLYNGSLCQFSARFIQWIHYTLMPTNCFYDVEKPTTVFDEDVPTDVLVDMDTAKR